MALDFNRQFAKAEVRRIDRAEGYALRPSRIHRSGAKAPMDHSILQPAPPQFVGTYGPKGKKHPQVLLSRRGNALGFKPQMTEGDVPFDRVEVKHNLRDAKAAGGLFPQWGRNPLAGLPPTESKPGKGLARPTLKRPTPHVVGFFVMGVGRPVRPPVCGAVEQARRRLMAL